VHGPIRRPPSSPPLLPLPSTFLESILRSKNEIVTAVFFSKNQLKSIDSENLGTVITLIIKCTEMWHYRDCAAGTLYNVKKCYRDVSRWAESAQWSIKLECRNVQLKWMPANCSMPVERQQELRSHPGLIVGWAAVNVSHPTSVLSNLRWSCTIKTAVTSEHKGRSGIELQPVKVVE